MILSLIKFCCKKRFEKLVGSVVLFTMLFSGCEEAQQKELVSDPYSKIQRIDTVNSKRYGTLYGSGLLKIKTPPCYQDGQEYYEQSAFLCDASLWLLDYQIAMKKELKRLKEDQRVLQGGTLNIDMTALNAALNNANVPITTRSDSLHELFEEALTNINVYSTTRSDSLYKLLKMITAMPDTFVAKAPLVEYVLCLSGNSRNLIDAISEDARTAMRSDSIVVRESARRAMSGIRRFQHNSDTHAPVVFLTDIQINIDPLMRDMLVHYTTVQIVDRFLSENSSAGIVIDQNSVNSLNRFTQYNYESTLPMMKAIQLGLQMWLTTNDSEKKALETELMNLKIASLHQMGRASQNLKSTGQYLPEGIQNANIFRASEKLRTQPENLKLVGG